MKKIFGMALAWILVSTVSIAQVASNNNAVSVDKVKTCVPTKECAAKAGVSLEECKKICTSKTAAEASSTNVASASFASDTKEVKKECCSSMKECAAKNGMTVAECKAKCLGKSKTAMEDSGLEKTTKVAAAILVNEIEEITPIRASTKKSCTGPSSCKKKKG